MPAGFAVAGTMISAYSAYQQGKQADKANQQMRDAQGADLAFRQQQYDDYMNVYDKPLLGPLREKAVGEGPINLGPEWAQINRNFDNAGRRVEGSLAKAGMLGSGFTRGANTALETGRAGALTDAYSRGIQGRDALKMQLAQIGRGGNPQANALSQGFQNQAGMYGTMSNNFSNNAANGWNAAGAGLNTLGQNWNKWGLGNGSPDPQQPLVQSTPESSTATQARILDQQATAAYSQPQPSFESYDAYRVPNTSPA